MARESQSVLFPFSSRYVPTMASEDDIRELIGRMSGAQRQGFHVTPAAAAVILAALRFYLAGVTCLAKTKTKTDSRDDRPRTRSEPYTGPLPTIGETKRHGVVACHIQCATPNCWNKRRFTFEELGLPDDTIFLHIPRLRRFRCKRCGCRSVRVSADWRDHKAHGNGKPIL